MLQGVWPNGSVRMAKYVCWKHLTLMRLCWFGDHYCVHTVPHKHWKEDWMNIWCTFNLIWASSVHSLDANLVNLKLETVPQIWIIDCLQCLMFCECKFSVHQIHDREIPNYNHHLSPFPPLLGTRGETSSMFLLTLKNTWSNHHHCLSCPASDNICKHFLSSPS